MASGEVLFFGKLRELAGLASEPLPAEAVGQPVSVLTGLMATRHPGLAGAIDHPSTRVCANQALIARKDDPLVTETDEIAFLPPMSGG